MGRPSFKIDHERLRKLREDKGLTQAGLASELCKRLGLEQDEDSRTVSYRRIEAQGRTSRKRAEAIANILGVTLAGNRSLSGVLCPPAPTRNNPSHVHQGGAGSDQGDSDQQQVAAA